MENHIPILDLSSEINGHWNELTEAIHKVLRSGQFILGENVREFEAETARYLGVKHAVGMNSGTDALLIGLRALGVQAGDEVITTAFSFFATAEVVGLLGATPVFVDIDPETFNLDVSSVEAAITKKTKAIIPVHLYGQAAEMSPLMAIANKHGIKVLEDAAQAFGAEYEGKKVGSMGHAGAFSFFPSKNLGAYGDGGLLVTNDDEVAAQARLLRVHGSRKRYYHEALGYASRLDEIQAAVLRVKLPWVNQRNEMRRKAASRYEEVLGKSVNFVTPKTLPNSLHIFHQYTIRVLDGRRDQVHAALAKRGITTMIYYPEPLHKLDVFGLSTKPNLPNAEAASREVLSLPMWAEITPEIQLAVANALLEA